jgi:hypothetical protein
MDRVTPAEQMGFSLEHTSHFVLVVCEPISLCKQPPPLVRSPFAPLSFSSPPLLSISFALVLRIVRATSAASFVAATTLSTYTTHRKQHQPHHLYTYTHTYLITPFGEREEEVCTNCNRAGEHRRELVSQPTTTHRRKATERGEGKKTASKVEISKDHVGPRKR